MPPTRNLTGYGALRANSRVLLQIPAYVRIHTTTRYAATPKAATIAAISTIMVGMLLFGIIFVAVNVLTLSLLLWRRYYQYYPLFCVALAATCWQAVARMFVVTAWPIPGVSAEQWVQISRASWMRFWAPGEYVLLAATAAALIEAVWRSVERLKMGWREMAVGCAALASAGVAMAVHTTFQGGNWYDVLVFARVWIMIAFMVFSALAIGIGYSANRKREWPRTARMHLWLYAALMAWMCLFSGWIKWDHNSLAYRVAESLCCVGWVMNADFRVKDLRDGLRLLALRHGGIRIAPRFGRHAPEPVAAPLRSARTVDPTAPQQQAEFHFR